MGSSGGVSGTDYRENRARETHEYLHKGVRHLCERGVTKVPTKYILPEEERPNSAMGGEMSTILKLPVIDFSQLQDSGSRSQALNSLAKACQEFGIFQLVNHGIKDEVISRMTDVSKRFFELPFEERSKYMSKDIASPARYGTSFNQNNDAVFCWRDFLKLSCNSLSDTLPFWPSSPVDLSCELLKEHQFVYVMLMEAVLESLVLMGTKKSSSKEEMDIRNNSLSEEFEDGSQLIVVNCYPACPEPDVTLGMPPHSDYGILTLLLQDQVQGLQIQHQGKWVTVEPLPNSFIVNVGDHLEIFSNGRYKSVLHRVVVNSSKSRISVASLHSLPFDAVVRLSPKLVDEANPTRYRDTDFAKFLEYIASCHHQTKISRSFLESRKMTS